MKALIADDEPVLARHLRARLGELWPELEVVGMAANGIEALEMIEGLKPDVAFLDIRMPGLSGLEVAQRRRRTPARAAASSSSRPMTSSAVQAFEREAVDYLLKPVSDERLGRAVERLRRRAAVAEPDDLLRRLQALLPKVVHGWVRASARSDVRLIAVDEVCYFQATDK